MCGIWAVFGSHIDFCKHCSSSFMCINHRGPEAWRLEYTDKLKNSCVGFHRLAIVDGKYGMQPMTLHKFPHCTLICNGELYNCKLLQSQYNFDYETECDVECILHLYKAFDIEKCVRSLDGVFAFCLVDIPNQRIVLGRDTYGVRPMFQLLTEDGSMAISSEAKALMDIARDLKDQQWSLKPFAPGTFEEFQILDDGHVKLLRSVRYYRPGGEPGFKTNITFNSLFLTDVYGNIRILFTEACKKRLMADRKIGCLLSGGLDSSLVAATVVKLAKEANFAYKIQTFATGMYGSPDLKAAKEVADYIGSEHHEVIFTEDDIKNVLDELIYCLESFDITTIRASIGMYLVSKYIRQKTDTIVLFSGEGADELAQGYIYFKNAPSLVEGNQESLRLLNDLYLFDGLRADRTTASQGLELRVPFLDIQLTTVFLNLPQQLRQPTNNIEKYTLRKAFDKTDLLPRHILWRPKEAFSDGVTSIRKSLFLIVQEIIENRISDEQFRTESEKYSHCKPRTKEALYYRMTFEKYFENQAKNFIPYFWMPKWTEVDDPSARLINHYKISDN